MVHTAKESAVDYLALAAIMLFATMDLNAGQQNNKRLTIQTAYCMPRLLQQPAALQVLQLAHSIPQDLPGIQAPDLTRARLSKKCIYCNESK